jgi:RNA polymerase sigma-70 factor (ECF subfamily)
MKEKWDDNQRAASSVARSKERRELESTALGRALAQLVGQFREKGEYIRIQVLELLFVKGWQNKDVAKFLNLTEQQIANYRFAAIRKLSEQLKAAGLPTDVFPELKEDPE